MYTCIRVYYMYIYTFSHNRLYIHINDICKNIHCYILYACMYLYRISVFERVAVLRQECEGLGISSPQGLNNCCEKCREKKSCFGVQMNSVQQSASDKQILASVIFHLSGALNKTDRVTHTKTTLCITSAAAKPSVKVVAPPPVALARQCNSCTPGTGSR